MQIIIPMAGRGSRFARAGYKNIKPLIEVDGRPIIEHIVGLFPGETDFLFICASDHLKETNLRAVLNRIAPLASPLRPTAAAVAPNTVPFAPVLVTSSALPSSE